MSPPESCRENVETPVWELEPPCRTCTFLLASLPIASRVLLNVRGFPNGQLPNQLRRAVCALRKDCDKHRIIRHLAAKVNQSERSEAHGEDETRTTPTQRQAGGP